MKKLLFIAILALTTQIRSAQSLTMTLGKYAYNMAQKKLQKMTCKNVIQAKPMVRARPSMINTQKSPFFNRWFLKAVKQFC